ncbi:Tetratricopeptide TPR_1 repeat-containing protein [Caldithrix abyssi DSM 13497]|uniref:Tetratricopeptide TPR_1 repeat-containing protein n=1 Tax=Caldithrix abyssi DSM 13497 TaxID=880073 RepID=H1XRW0_CALAY|nr:tetratricopeptide repeat protein [Caldithrix abyssi]APF17183.1 Tfp pilus assembly protein PilF [Caldithrix abyssi DSM 13497]EHO41320.1 Tetratricopeptide TPR_1 repeat-containing protein [Caldithrix abyssi DSM 13497]
MRYLVIFLLLLLSQLLFAQNQTLQKALIDFSQNRYAQAEKLLFQHAQTHADDPTPLNLLGHIYMNRQNFKKAIQVFQKAQELRPDDGAIALNLGKALEKTGYFTLAQRQYLRAMQDTSLTRLAKMALAQLYYKQSHFKKALKLYRELIKYDARNGYFFKQAGRCALKVSKDIGQAETYLQQALRFTPGDLDVYVLLYNLYKKKNDWPNALQIAQQGLIQFPQNRQLLLVVGDSYFATGKYDQAISPYRSALQAGDSSAYVFKKLGAAYYYLNDYPSALLSLKKSVKRDDQDPITYYFLGLTQKALNLKKAAIVSLNKAVSLSLPDFLTDIYFHLAEAYQKQKKYTRAIAMYKKLMETDSSQVMPLFYLATIYDDYYEDRQTPLRYYKKFLEQAGDSVDERYKNYALERMKIIREKLHFLKGRKEAQ